MNRSIAGWTFLALLAPALAHAQQPAESLDVLAQHGRPGQRIVVTDVDGNKIKGKLAAIDHTSIGVRWHDGFAERTHIFDKANVREVRKTDSIWNGLLIGLGAGFVATEVWVHQLCGPRGSDAECAAIVSGVGWMTLAPGGAAALT